MSVLHHRLNRPEPSSVAATVRFPSWRKSRDATSIPQVLVCQEQSTACAVRQMPSSLSSEATEHRRDASRYCAGACPPRYNLAIRLGTQLKRSHRCEVTVLA